MDYPEALAYISATGRFGIKLGLERTRALLDELGAPDEGLRGVLVGGTNGKGSTCAFITSVLVAAGYRVGTMPKPHLQSYTERVCIDGKPISETKFAALMTEIEPAIARVAERIGPPTEFEMLTAAAIHYMRGAGIDLLVCEVGLGGRLDSTNVLDLGVKVITSVALDHQQYLGADVASIAREKAGIFRSQDDVILGRLPAKALGVAEACAEEVGAARIWRLGREIHVDAKDLGWDGVEALVSTPSVEGRALRSSMLGGYQADNLALAVAAIDLMRERHGLNISEESLRGGIRDAVWPGRLELVEGEPRILLDGGHNPDAVARVVAAVGDLLPHGDGVPQVVFGAMQDKDWKSMLELLPNDWPAVLTAVDEERATPPDNLLEESRALGRGSDVAVTGSALALQRARDRAGPSGLVLVVGSLYLAGEARTALRR